MEMIIGQSVQVALIEMGMLFRITYTESNQGESVTMWLTEPSETVAAVSETDARNEFSRAFPKRIILSVSQVRY